jgi:hypothetical protein
MPAVYDWKRHRAQVVAEHTGAHSRLFSDNADGQPALAKNLRKSKTFGPRAWLHRFHRPQF